ncbi:MAG: amidohydrolase family protein, partial [Chloroflexota bacterium]|nr:amidohydrolase family protein [Chloroflexota bacterium]
RAGYAFGSGDEDLRLGAVKIVLEETTGSLTPSREVLREQIVQAHRAGFQVALHAVEETTLEAAVEALEHALGRYPRRDHRHRIEHGSVCPPPLLRRLRALKVVVVTQPSFLYYSGERYRAEVPPYQQPWLYRVKSFHRAGLRPAASSDAPVVPPNPVMGLYAAVTRKSQEGVALLPEEAISPQGALEMYTRNAAYAAFEERAKGSLVAGKLADLVLLNHDPTAVSPDEIKDIRVEKTILGGRVFSEAGEEAAQKPEDDDGHHRADVQHAHSGDDRSQGG